MGVDKVTRIVIFPETGEVNTILNEGDRILRAKSIKSNKENNKDSMDWSIGNFLKFYVPEMSLMLKELSNTEKAFLFSIMPYVSYDDCHLQYGNGVDISTEDLVEITGSARSVVYETINSLVKKDVLYRGKNSRNRQFFVNPWLFSKGNRVNKVLKTMFKNYRIKVLGGKMWKDISHSEMMRSR